MAMGYAPVYPMGQPTWPMLSPVDSTAAHAAMFPQYAPGPVPVFAPTGDDATPRAFASFSGSAYPYGENSNGLDSDATQSRIQSRTQSQSQPHVAHASELARSLSTSAAPRSAPEDEFPYVAPRNQQVGHARRVSVATNPGLAAGSSQAQAQNMGLDALGLDSTAHERMPWQTHGARRVSALH